MARRTTRDHLLAEEETRDERRQSRRLSAHRVATLRAGELTLTGSIRDCSSGGVFLATQLLVEVGERGILVVDGVEITVQVVWLRGNAHDDGPGMGLAFDDEATRRDAILAVLAP